MTEKRFKLVKCIENHWGLVDTSLEDVDQLVLIHTSKLSVNYLVNLLNSFVEGKGELTTKCRQLKKENVQLRNKNSILWNEIGILMEQGAEPSDAFKEYLDSISTEYTRFWNKKLLKAKKEGVV